MGRPTQLQKGSTLHWVLPLYNPADGVTLVDADAVPVLVVRKNGEAVDDSVSVAKREDTTGIYDCTYDPTDELSGDQYTVEERAIIGEVEHFHSWQFGIVGDVDAPRQLTLSLS